LTIAKRIAAVLIACSVIGSLKKGESTINDALITLGQPTTRIAAGDGTTTFIYTYAEASVKAASFIPVVGLVAGGTDVSVSSTTLRFDTNGKLIDISRMDSQHNSSMGMPPGRSSAPSTSQQGRQP
jgi:hypothetical protein